MRIRFTLSAILLVLASPAYTESFGEATAKIPGGRVYRAMVLTEWTGRNTVRDTRALPKRVRLR